MYNSKEACRLKDVISTLFDLLKTAQNAFKSLVLIVPWIHAGNEASQDPQFCGTIFYLEGLFARMSRAPRKCPVLFDCVMLCRIYLFASWKAWLCGRSRKRANRLQESLCVTNRMKAKQIQTSSTSLPSSTSHYNLCLTSAESLEASQPKQARLGISSDSNRVWWSMRWRERYLQTPVYWVKALTTRTFVLSSYAFDHSFKWGCPRTPALFFRVIQPRVKSQSKTHGACTHSSPGRCLWDRVQGIYALWVYPAVFNMHENAVRWYNLLREHVFALTACVEKVPVPNVGRSAKLPLLLQCYHVGCAHTWGSCW